MVTSTRQVGLPEDPVNAQQQLKSRVLQTLVAQGFGFDDGTLTLPAGLTKDGVRDIHRAAVTARLEKLDPRLKRHESEFLHFVAAGETLRNPSAIAPTLVEVQADTNNELLFRYLRAHWSIPVSSGYGRRLRFLVYDANNGCVIGLLGIGDPVFSLRSRDAWIGWSKEQARRRLLHVADAFIMGAIPPYSYLLAGKLVAMLALSNEVREAFARKYHDKRTYISGRVGSGELALLTTVSALGRTSIYNRISNGSRPLWVSAGMTRGSGAFHFPDDLYVDIHAFAVQHCVATAKQPTWGKGFRNRREVIRKALHGLGLSPDLVYHGIRREVLVGPTATNAQAFLKGEADELEPLDLPASQAIEYFRTRWMLPRAERERRHLTFQPESYSLFSTDGSLKLQAVREGAA